MLPSPITCLAELDPRPAVPKLLCVCDPKATNGMRPATLPGERQQSVMFTINELTLMPLLEHYMTLPLIKKCYIFNVIRQIQYFGGAILNTQNMQETNLCSFPYRLRMNDIYIYIYIVLPTRTLRNYMYFI
jgi:hypothetical protein